MYLLALSKPCALPRDPEPLNCWPQVEAEEEEFEEEFVGTVDPSILHFLLASGDRISSKQLRDDLMTMLIAGHETTAAVLTWTMYCLSEHPEIVRRIQAEVRVVER